MSAEPDFQDAQVGRSDPADTPRLSKCGGTDSKELLFGFGTEFSDTGVI